MAAMVKRASEAAFTEISRSTSGKMPRQFDKVPPDMPSSRPTRRRRVERRQARVVRRARLVGLLVVLSAVFLVALGLTAFAGTTTAPTSAIVPRQPLANIPQNRPTTEIVALRGPVRLQLPISQSRLTAIGYHSAGDGALSLHPVGHQANEGLVSRVVHGIFGGGGGSPKWYQLAGGGTSALDVGAPIGSDVYSPVDGTVVAIPPFVVEGKTYGSEIDVQPQNAPSVVVAVTQLVADPALNVGTAVVSGATKLGRVADLATRRAASTRALHERRREPRDRRGASGSGPRDRLGRHSPEDPLSRGRLRRPRPPCGRGAPARAARAVRRRPRDRQRRERRRRRRHHGEAQERFSFK